jgi:hypothetical protein
MEMVFVISRIKNLPEAAYAVSGLHLLLQINNIDSIWFPGFHFFTASPFSAAYQKVSGR